MPNNTEYNFSNNYFDSDSSIKSTELFFIGGDCNNYYGGNDEYIMDVSSSEDDSIEDEDKNEDENKNQDDDDEDEDEGEGEDENKDDSSEDENEYKDDFNKYDKKRKKHDNKDVHDYNKLKIKNEYEEEYNVSNDNTYVFNMDPIKYKSAKKNILKKISNKSYKKTDLSLYDEFILNDKIIDIYEDINNCVNYDVKPIICKLNIQNKPMFKSINDIITILCHNN